ncbi:CGNR zinc finger domain-containing protein [Umezawaea sp. Da 62-37]|uniref:CGNR zinc finger domain-containing protein n=1 Tax=Umezawaea sp. Da 62-37 TaxID=3075927 RepID=UPI0028F6D7D6|nr:CGNR zinc finger domain-containing protein [Umezawaea sp. Da 62-37]WNV86794.1 CGNR zinc finger domain-containing protein [Umezawaea sp. Da 62-37]
MHFNPYGGVAAELAATLVNALVTADPPLSSDELVATLREHGYRPAGVLDARDMTLLTAWAHRLAGVFAGEGDRVDSLNALLAESATQPYVSRHDGRAPHLHFAREEGPMVDRLRAYTAAGLAHAFCQDPDRLGRCDRAGCGVVYVDTSRNGRRRFCSTRCANRVHVAGHRDRRAG